MTLYYTKEHEYIRVNGDIGTIGISAYAGQELGDIVFVQLPIIGRKVAQKESISVVESVKAASEIYAPVSGTIVGVNEALEASPGTINEEPLGNGWIVKLHLTNPSELASLMRDMAYTNYLRTILLA